MKKTQHNSGTSLFLMEMILALLFLSLSSTACIQIFAAARKNRIQAEQWNQIQAKADTDRNFSWDSTKHTLTFSTEISDTQQLCTVLEIFYPAKNNGSVLEIRQWNTDLTNSWDPDTRQNIFKGE